MKNLDIAVSFSLMIIAVVALVAGCATTSLNDGSGDSPNAPVLVMREGSYEVWRIKDATGALVHTCYLAINTAENGQPNISCP